MPHRNDDIGCEGRYFVMIRTKACGGTETVVVLHWMADFPDAARAADRVH